MRDVLKHYETNSIDSHGKLISAKEIDYKKNVMAGFCWTNEWLNDNKKIKNIFS